MYDSRIYSEKKDKKVQTVDKKEGPRWRILMRMLFPPCIFQVSKKKSTLKCQNETFMQKPVPPSPRMEACEQLMKGRENRKE